MQIKNFFKSFSDECWNIGFIQNSFDSILRGDNLQIKWIKHNYKDGWFADPFVLDVNDTEIHLLVEEFYKPIQRGRISRLIIDKETNDLKKLDVVLELPSHLSFPAIKRVDNKVYIYPENGESGALNLYEYNTESNTCKKVGSILNEPVADAIVTNIDSNELLFCTKQPNPNGNKLDIYIYEEGKFVPIAEHIFEENVARMAGDFFKCNGKLYRPTQECNVQYGHAVTIQEVILNNDKFDFKEVRRMYSVHPKLNIGMHTFNSYKGIIVTDALGFENMWFRNILKFFKLLP